MESDWDVQLARLLKGYRDPEIRAGRLDEIGRAAADLLREEAVLDANLESLLPAHQDPSVDPRRLDEIGEELAGLLRRPARRHRFYRPRSSAGWAWAAAVGVAAAALIAVAASSRAPSVKPVKAVEPMVSVPEEAPREERRPEPRSAPPPEPPREAPRPEPPPPAPLIAPPPAPPPATAPRETRVEPAPSAIAALERVEGAVDVAGAVGTGLPAGSRITSQAGRAVVAYPDGTRLELGPESTLEIAARPLLSRGTALAVVVRQVAGRSFVISTPQADAKVLGTRFLLTVTADATRLEVREGKVKLARHSDGGTVDVSAGQFAVAAKSVALLTRPLPEEPRTVFLEIEDFGTARGVKPADGPVKRPFLEPFDSAQGGWCVAVPGADMEVVGETRLAKGTWHLWVRYRDEPGTSKIGFTAMLNGQAIGQGATPGKNRDWLWKRFTFAWPGGVARLALRSTFEGVKASPSQADYRQSPYGALNRWDRLCLSPDDAFTPD